MDMSARFSDGLDFILHHGSVLLKRIHLGVNTVCLGVFAAYDPQAEDQARSLGASPLQILRHITLPAVLPGILVGAMFSFLVSWSQYILTLTIGGGRVQTLPLLLFQFATSGRNDITGAIGIIYILPGVLILILTARHLTGRSAGLAGFGR